MDSRWDGLALPAATGEGCREKGKKVELVDVLKRKPIFTHYGLDISNFKVSL